MGSIPVTRLLWLGFLAAIVGLAWQFQGRLEMVFAGRGRLTVETAPNRVVLNWRGKIEAPMATKIEEAFREHADAVRTFELRLHSPGGSLGHGAEVIRTIKRIQQTHRLETVVDNGNSCASMCVPVYLAGDRRVAGPKARFMFHEVSYHDSYSGKVEDVPKSAIGRATDDFFERYLKPAGVDTVWLGQLREAIRGKDVWRTAEELVDARAGVVLELK